MDIDIDAEFYKKNYLDIRDLEDEKVKDHFIKYGFWEGRIASQKMLDEYLQGNIPEFKGESVSEYYSRPNFVDANAITKIIEMGGDYDDVRETLKIDISDERLDDILGYSDNKFYDNMKKGGLASFKDGGIMNLGGKEMDMRTGGFIPIGAKERADDVPARLSKNEFVMTADAVRAAGGGSVNQGAKRMYNLMHNLEARA